MPPWLKSFALKDPTFWSGAANWVLAIVAVIGICVALRSLRALQGQARIMIRQSRILQRQANTLERQTQATEEAAKAAKGSADALINIERAWIVVAVDLVARQVLELTTGGGEQKTAIELLLIWRNQGKTPAWISEAKVKFAILEDSTLPLTPDFTTIENMHPQIETLAGNSDSPGWRVQVDCDGRMGFGRIPVVCGVVAYKDIFGEIRTTTFGYYIRHDGSNTLVLLTGYPEYNKST
jgi:hypothetical protein